MSLQRDQSGACASTRPSPAPPRMRGRASPSTSAGCPAGELRETPNTGGSGWIVSSLDADLQGVTIGRQEAFGLGRICRAVERAAAAGAGGDGPLAREEELRRLAQEAPPEPSGQVGDVPLPVLRLGRGSGCQCRAQHLGGRGYRRRSANVGRWAVRRSRTVCGSCLTRHSRI